MNRPWNSNSGKLLKLMKPNHNLKLLWVACVIDHGKVILLKMNENEMEYRGTKLNGRDWEKRNE